MVDWLCSPAVAALVLLGAVRVSSCVCVCVCMCVYVRVGWGGEGACGDASSAWVNGESCVRFDLTPDEDRAGKRGTARV